MNHDIRWVPPDRRREPINIHPDARTALHDLLMNDPLWADEGVGYSEFIMWAVDNSRSEKQSAWGAVGTSVTMAPEEDTESTSGDGYLRYVEVSWNDTDGKTWFTCSIEDARTFRQAVENTKKKVLYQHPAATEVEEWLARRITHKVAARIERRMLDGSWNGWMGHGKMRERVEDDA
jgi:hypothetical protein